MCSPEKHQFFDYKKVCGAFLGVVWCGSMVFWGKFVWGQENAMWIFGWVGNKVGDKVGERCVT